MPATAEILGVALIFGDDEDLGMPRHRLDEFVDVEGAEAAAQREMPFWRQTLVAEKDDAMVEQRLVQVGGLRVVEVLRQINACDDRAERAGQRRCLDRLVGHRFLRPRSRAAYHCKNNLDRFRVYRVRIGGTTRLRRLQPFARTCAQNGGGPTISQPCRSAILTNSPSSSVGETSEWPASSSNRPPARPGM
jgi:hypothetical protein